MKKILLIALAVSLGACNQYAGPKEASGGLLGGAAGALLGAQFGRGNGQLVGVAIGALIGSQLGSSFGHDLDAKDKELIASSMQKSLEQAPDNTISTWRNPNNNHSGSVKIRQTQGNGTKVCRTYTHTVQIEGRSEQVEGRACRNPNGIWVVN